MIASHNFEERFCSRVFLFRPLKNLFIIGINVVFICVFRFRLYSFNLQTLSSVGFVSVWHITKVSVCHEVAFLWTCVLLAFESKKNRNTVIIAKMCLYFGLISPFTSHRRRYSYLTYSQVVDAGRRSESDPLTDPFFGLTLLKVQFPEGETNK